MNIQDTKDLPCLTRDIPGIPLVFKKRYEDFEVREIPAYEPCGEGTHLFFEVEKKGISTHEAARHIGRALGVSPSDLGTAGLKDARAVTRQYFSAEQVSEEKLRALEFPNIRILSVARHGNKLRKGHLKGNRFRLKLRDVDPGRFGDCERVLGALVSRGVPNYFGSQRFGMRGDTAEVGKALLAGDFEEAARRIAGSPGPSDTGQILEARTAFSAGDYARARGLWPRGFSEAERLSRILAANGGNFKRAVLAVDRKMLQFYISAFQSQLFNAWVAARLPVIDQVLEGDWAVKHESGGMFLVEDLPAENPRAARFEISAAGPMFGRKMRPAAGAARAFEDEILENCGTERDTFSGRGLLGCPGDRKPVRFRPEDVVFSGDSDEEGKYWRLEFTLPAGCYATSLLREIGKDQLREGGIPEGVS